MASVCLILTAQSLAAYASDSPNSKPIKVAAAESAHAEEAAFEQLVDKYFDYLFKTNPGDATAMGFHQYDALAPDFSAAAIQSKIEELKSFAKQFDALKKDGLSAQSKIDLQLIQSHTNSWLLMNEELKAWQKNPDQYSSEASSMVYNLLTRDFAPLKDRLKLVIAREKKIGDLLKAGKANLKNPPKIYTEVAIEQLPGIISLFKDSVTEKFKDVTDKELKAEFEKTNNEVIAELQDYLKFLKEEVLPKSVPNFAFGEDIYRKKLLYDEMEEHTIDELLAQGETELRRLQKEFIETGKEIDPKKTTLEVFTSISSDHAPPDKLLASIAGVLDQLRQYCITHNIISIPYDDKLKVEETPAFMRALTFASMDSPGAFETKAKEAYYYVTLPEPSWSKERTEEHMRSFCKYDVINTSVHEAFPGHFVQGLWERKAPSKTAKILGANSNVEGWAHYCEQMMIEQGLENGDKKLKMVVLHDALLRCCRYMVGIKMHTRGMSMEDGINYFIKEGYMEKANAERETKRGTMDATYLVYTLGKLQLIALRDDYKKLKGAEFSLKDFHDKVMATGKPPVKIIRQILLGTNK